MAVVGVIEDAVRVDTNGVKPLVAPLSTLSPPQPMKRNETSRKAYFFMDALSVTGSEPIFLRSITN
jgi:hypothetical protein